MNQQEFDNLVTETCSVTVTDSEAPLVDLGVDSIAHLGLVMALEDRYGVEIDPDCLTDPALSSSAGLRRHIESLVTVA